MKLLIGTGVRISAVSADYPIGPNDQVHFPVMITHWHFAVYDLLSKGQSN
jgi:hypothetical protein